MKFYFKDNIYKDTTKIPFTFHFQNFIVASFRSLSFPKNIDFDLKI